MYGAILAGGKGRRFWPYSRGARPKQLLDLTGEGSMLALTFRRLARFVPEERIIVLTIGELVPRIREELPRLKEENIFAEPVGRNTAPSIAMAALLIRHRGEDVPFVTCPADHAILKEDDFSRIVRSASSIAADRDALVTFGVVPSYPATGYGYIEAGAETETRDGVTFFRAMRFHEKPDAAKAAAYCSAGGHYWNSGIFLWRPSVYLRACARHLPEGEGPLTRIADALGRGDERRVIEREFPQLPAISVDYGILEKAANVVVAPADIGWSDVGSWDSLGEIVSADREGNLGAGERHLVDVRNCIFFNPGGTTAAVGVEDVIVVVDGKTVLVCRRGESQRVREITDLLEREKREELL